MYELTGDRNYRDAIENYLSSWLPPTSIRPHYGGGKASNGGGGRSGVGGGGGRSGSSRGKVGVTNEAGVTFTPKGLAFKDQWGANRYAANTAFLSALAADNGIRPEVREKWTRQHERGEENNDVQIMS